MLVLMAKLFVLTTLFAYLRARHPPRPRDRTPETPSVWSGRVFNAAPLRPRLEQVRHDYATALPSSAQPLCDRESLVARARRALRHLHYFRALSKGGRTVER